MAHVFKSGREQSVKNLGWLLRHAGEAQLIEIRANGLNGNEASLIVTGDGWTFYSPFASLLVLLEWIRRPVFAGLPVVCDMSQCTTLRELRSANKLPEWMTARRTPGEQSLLAGTYNWR
jgi:hypothetical protein